MTEGPEGSRLASGSGLDGEGLKRSLKSIVEEMERPRKP